jgi:hypothetical protein
MTAEIQQAISAKLLAEVAAGATVSEAFDRVFGAGSYARFAGTLYDDLRAKHAATANA